MFVAPESEEREIIVANENQGEGILDQIKGKVEQAVGGASGNHQQQAEGMGNEAKGNVQQGAGDLQNKVTGGGTQDQGEGMLDQAKGKFNQAAGGITGDRHQQAEGAGQEAGGNIQQGIGNLKDKITGN